ncbi:MAG: hypothetical protein ACTHOU_19030 [Aureliella sp.]
MLHRPAILSLISALALAGQLSAHPGHAVEVEQPHALAHYATHPDHLAMWLVVTVAASVLWLAVHRARRQPAPAYARAAKR